MAEQQHATDPNRSALLFPGILGEQGAEGVSYWLKDRLNRGSFGEAWTITRVRDNQVFAGKVMFLRELSTKQQLRALTEVSCIRSSAVHFGCVNFVEDVQHDGKLLIVMEYCNAGDLRYQIRHLRDNGYPPYEENDLKKILLQLVISLNFLHKNHILHRDMKAENVLLSTSGLVKIGDFGMSKEYTTTLTNVAETFCGTPAYISPEVWQQKSYGRHADVWSLGVILYEMMTSTFPFNANDWNTLAARVCTGEYVEPDQERYSQPLRDILRACLQVDPQARIDTNGLLRLPYIQDALEKFPAAVELSKGRMSDEIYQSVMTGLHEIIEANKANNSSAVPATPTGTVGSAAGVAASEETILAGTVGKFKEGQFHQRYLRLTSDCLYISQKQDSTKPTPLPLKNILAATGLVESNSNEHQNVFALQENEDKCYWFRAEGESPTMQQWVQCIRERLSKK